MGPPTDISPRDLFRKLLETPRPSEVIDFPRLDRYGKPVTRVRIQVLRMEDHDNARLKGQKIALEKLKAMGVEKDSQDPVIREVIGDAVAKELLALACLYPEPTQLSTEDKPDYGRAFAEGKELDKLLTADEIAVLFNAYILVQHKYGPFEKTIETDADLNAWVKRIGEGASEFPLAALPLQALTDLAYSSLERNYTLSAILESLLPSLPDTLRSSLEPFAIGITSSGSDAAQSTASPASDHDVSMSVAAQMAEQNKNS